MKAIIFAGGVGTRLWPLSRKSSPKQFENVIGNKSTLQLAAERLLPEIDWEDIYIATSERYIPIISKHLPKLPTTNIIGEPETRDVGPAVALSTAIVYKKYPYSPIVILWSDHIVKNQEVFKSLLKHCEKIVSNDKDKIIFIGQKPRFASQNLGWIEFGKVASRVGDLEFHSFTSFNYRPSLPQAQKFLKSGNFAWNLGYFVTTPHLLWKLFEKHQPEIFAGMKKIYHSVGTDQFKSIVKSVYPKLPKISFDNAILENIGKENALVVCQDIGWSDVGAWEALKEALQKSPEQNVTSGKVLLNDCLDTLVYNYTDQLVVTIDLNGFLVVNTHDVVLVCHKNSVPKIKKLVEKLAQTENEHLV